MIGSGHSSMRKFSHSHILSFLTGIQLELFFSKVYVGGLFSQVCRLKSQGVTIIDRLTAQRYRYCVTSPLPLTPHFSSIPNTFRRELCPIRCTGAPVHKHPCGCCRLPSLSPNPTSGEEIFNHHQRHQRHDDW